MKWLKGIICGRVRARTDVQYAYTGMKPLLEEIEKRYGFQNTFVRLVSENSFLLERHKDHATISVIAKDIPGEYSVDVEVPDENVPLIGINKLFVSHDLDLETVFDVTREFIQGS